MYLCISLFRSFVSPFVIDSFSSFLSYFVVSLLVGCLLHYFFLCDFFSSVFMYVFIYFCMSLVCYVVL